MSAHGSDPAQSPVDFYAQLLSAFVDYLEGDSWFFDAAIQAGTCFVDDCSPANEAAADGVVFSLDTLWACCQAASFADLPKSFRQFQQGLYGSTLNRDLAPLGSLGVYQNQGKVKQNLYCLVKKVRGVL